MENQNFPGSNLPLPKCFGIEAAAIELRPESCVGCSVKATCHRQIAQERMDRIAVKVLDREFNTASPNYKRSEIENKIIRDRMDALPLSPHQVNKQKANERQVGATHYKDMGVQPWDVVDTWPLEQRIGYYRGGALKYLMRMGSKDENMQEIAKGQHYLEKLLEVLKENKDADQKTS